MVLWSQKRIPWITLALLGLPTIAVPIASDATSNARVFAADPPTGVSTAERCWQLWQRAQQLADQGKTADAIETAEELLKIQRESFGTWHPDTVYPLQQIAQWQEALGNLQASRSAWQQLLDVQTRNLGKDHYQVNDTRVAMERLDAIAKLPAEQRTEIHQADRLLQEVVDQYRRGEIGLALSNAERVLACYRTHFGDRSSETARAANNLALLLEAKGDYGRAEPLFQEALEIKRKVLGEQHPETAATLNNLAMLHESLANFDRAESLYLESLKIKESTLGREHHETATTLNNLGMLYRTLGDFRRAAALCEEARRIQQVALGPESPESAITLNNLVTVYSAMAEYARAERLGREALESRRKMFGENSLKTATSWNNLAELSLARGDLAEAESRFRKALGICLKNAATGDSVCRAIQQNLAVVLTLSDRHESAIELLQEIATTDAEALGETHPDYATALGNLAVALEAAGDHPQARTNYQRSLKIRRESLGEHHPQTATSINALAGLHLATGEIAEAVALYHQALEVRREQLGPQHLDTAATMKNLGVAYYLSGRLDDAKGMLEESLRLYTDHVDSVVSVLPERQQRLFTSRLRSTLDAYLSLTAKLEIPPTEIYRHVLAWKGTSLARQRHWRLAGAHPELMPLIERRQKVSAKLAQLALTTPEAEQVASRLQQLDQWTQERDALEREIVDRSSITGRHWYSAEPQQLSATLPPESRLLDLLEYDHTMNTGGDPGVWLERRLMAFVIDDRGGIVCKSLGPVEPIATAIERWRQDFGDDAVGREAARSLRQLLWEPLANQLNDAKLILYSPDGVTSRFPLAALPARDPSRYLLEEIPVALAPVPSLLPAIVTELPDPTRSPPSLLAVGNLNYGDELLLENLFAVTESQAKESSLFSFSPLPQTGREMTEVRDRFEQAFENNEVQLLQGNQATEPKFCEEAPKHRFLHLATHGFFASAEVESALLIADEESRPAIPSDNLFAIQAIAEIHPGLLSGIALSGANQSPEALGGDGILTAEEVASLDLSKTDLLVLSACETGLGRLAPGEGVLGLQRAFHAAGVKTVIASLWKVDDQATRLLMDRFYERLWRDKQPPLVALREAQLWLLQHPDAVAAKPGRDRLPPSYWAAFVLSGDWR